MKLKLHLMAALVVLPGLSFAQSTEELAKASQNPLTTMINVPVQNNSNLGIGSDDSTQNILNVQPVIPFEINDDWNLITRTIIPVVSYPGALTKEGRVNGIGDTTVTGWFSPNDSGDLIWGVGPVLLLPTATDDVLGSDKWGAGLSTILVTMPGNWVMGILFSNVWSFGGAGEKDVNLFVSQYFINYNLGDGLYITSAPLISANWEADDDHRWTVPFGIGMGQIFSIGDQKIDGQISAYKNVITPDDYGADWQVRVQLKFMFPK